MKPIDWKVSVVNFFRGQRGEWHLTRPNDLINNKSRAVSAVHHSNGTRVAAAAQWLFIRFLRARSTPLSRRPQVCYYFVLFWWIDRRRIYWEDDGLINRARRSPSTSGGSEWWNAFLELCGTVLSSLVEVRFWVDCFWEGWKWERAHILFGIVYVTASFKVTITLPQ